MAHITAAEIDPIAHAANLEKTIDRVTFASFGAEAIDADDGTFDIVVMLKSLHHVPTDLMDAAFGEIHRVLKPGGLVYISEPVFAGELNEVIRLFHDEEQVRLAAFHAVQRAVESGRYELTEERFFLNPVRLESFAQFRHGILDATHTQHNVSDELLLRVQDKFESFAPTSADAPYYFETPNRVDLLRAL